MPQAITNRIDRRKALAVIAAVPAAAALAGAAPAFASGEPGQLAPLVHRYFAEVDAFHTDAELLEHGERCKALALETTRLGKLSHKAADRTEEAFYATAPERWGCHFGLGDAGEVGRVPGSVNAWRVFAVNRASKWFAFRLGTKEVKHLPTKWIRLKARTEAEAKSEARALDRKLDKDFFEKRKQAGVPFNHDAHYDNWSRSHGKLRRAVARLARLKATTLEGLNMKAMVLAIAHDAFDDPNIWNEPLQNSITRDIRRMAA